MTETEDRGDAGHHVDRDGERYLDIAAAADYLGKGLSTVWLYVKRYGWATYRFPLYGKRTFLKQSDLDALRNAPPEERRPKDDAA
jgi:hypothetical protein